MNTKPRNTQTRDRHRNLIARDQPPCYHCGQPIDYNAKYPADNAFVVDHLIPIAAGGTDTINNKVASHAACNRTKSDRPYPTDIIRRSTSLNW